MVLTVEEKLARLEKWEDWEVCSPEQKAFLIGIANNLGPDVAYSRAFPNVPASGRGSIAFHASRLLQYKRVKAGLDVIQYVKPEPVYTQREALEDITFRIRKNNLEDETYIKLLTLLAKMNGWDKPKEPPKSPEEKQEDVNQTVVELEKKRRGEL